MTVLSIVRKLKLKETRKYKNFRGASSRMSSENRTKVEKPKGEIQDIKSGIAPNAFVSHWNNSFLSF
jgi:hypothetical protein